MSGFASAIGFMFSFFIIAGIVGYSFVSIQENLQDSVEMMEHTTGIIENSKASFSVDASYYDSGRMRLYLTNDGEIDILLKNQLADCFDLYVNGVFINKEDYNHYLDNPLGNYYLLDIGETTILDFIINLNESSDNNFKIVSCTGYTYEHKIDSAQFNWIDETYKRKSDFTIENTGPGNLMNNYFSIELNSTNFDFTKGSDDTISFFLPVIDENTVLDITFDDYKQTLDDFSRYSNTVYLGNNNLANADDPSLVEGIYFGALDLDGVNDFSRIVTDNTLLLDKGLTISTWIKWDTVGNNFQYIFTNGLVDNAISVINDGGVNDNKVNFDLSITGTKRIVTSNTLLDNSWHHIVGTFNGTEMKLYQDNVEVGNLVISGDIDTAVASNYIGSSDGTTNFFNGTIDDLKVFNFGLNSSAINSLFLNELRHIELNYTINNWSAVDSLANISVKLPYIRSNDNITVGLYYYQFGESFESGGAPLPPAPSAPDQIVDLVANGANGQASLTWSAPNDNGDPITKYTVEYGTVVSGLFNYTYIDDAVANATITGLINDVEWQFRVYATNVNGDAGVSNTATTTPNGLYWMILDVTTNLGFDGTANQNGPSDGVVELAQLSHPDNSSDASDCAGERYSNSNMIIAQEYTPVFASQTEFGASSSAIISTYTTSTTNLVWDVSLIEYNDATGDVGSVIGTAQNTTTAGTPTNLNLNFNNPTFNISAGNRIKVVLNGTLTGNNKWAYLCYGTGTQSRFEFNIN